MVKKIYHIFLRSINEIANNAEVHLTNLGWFLIIAFPIFYFINRSFIGLIGYESIFLRLSIGVLGAILVIRHYLPKKLMSFMPLFFCGTLIFSLPFFFFFMLFNNPSSNIWQINVSIGLFFLSFFLDWIEYIIFAFLGFILAWLVFYLTSAKAQLPVDINSLIATYTSPIVYLAIFSRKKDNIVQERLLAMKTLAGTVAHEMRTPFFGIRLNTGCIKKFLPTLIEGYNKAKEARLEIKPISEKNLQHLVEAPEDLDKITTSASLVIDMLLVSLKDDPHKSKNYEICSIGTCIEEMFREYPLSDEEKSLITWKRDPNFTFYGNTLLMKHVLFNLLKNALYYVKAADKDNGHISIWTESTPKGNTLYFKDTGKGMPASMVAHIFDRFYTHTRHGTGIGLAFCQSVMEGFGGTITCESKEGGYTIFVLKFPLLKEPS